MVNKSLLEDFERITDELLTIDMNRNIDDIIVEIEEKLDKREMLISKINFEEKNVMTDETRKRIVEKEYLVKKKFEEIKLSISSNISNVIKEKSLSSVKRKAHRGYMNIGKQNDGYFIDKKK